MATIDDPNPTQLSASNSLLTLRNAAENASVGGVTDKQIIAALRHGHGTGSHLRAIFGDVSFHALAKAAAANGIDHATLLASYRHAKSTAAAFNPELDRELRDDWWV